MLAVCTKTPETRICVSILSVITHITSAVCDISFVVVSSVVLETVAMTSVSMVIPPDSKRLERGEML